MTLLDVSIFNNTDYVEYLRKPTLLDIKDACAKYRDLRVKTENLNGKKYIFLEGRLQCVNKGEDVNLPIQIQIPLNYPKEQPQIIFPRTYLDFSNKLVIDKDGFSTPTIPEWKPLQCLLTQYIDLLVEFYSIDSNYPYNRPKGKQLRSSYSDLAAKHQQDDTSQSSSEINADCEDYDLESAKYFVNSYANNILDNCNNNMNTLRYMRAQNELTQNMIDIMNKKQQQIKKDLEDADEKIPDTQISPELMKIFEDEAQTLSINDICKEIEALYENQAITEEQKDQLKEIFQ